MTATPKAPTATTPIAQRVFSLSARNSAAGATKGSVIAYAANVAVSASSPGTLPVAGAGALLTARPSSLIATEGFCVPATAWSVSSERFVSASRRQSSPYSDVKRLGPHGPAVDSQGFWDNY